MENKEKVRALKRLRLITNTENEWNTLYGNLKIHNGHIPCNTPAKKSEQMSSNKSERENFIYNAVRYDILKKYDINLDEFLEDYAASSKTQNGLLLKIKRAEYNKKKIWNPDTIANFLFVNFSPSATSEDFHDIKEKDVLNLQKIDPTLLLCWVNKWLPVFDEMRGDTSSEEIKEVAAEAHQVLNRMGKLQSNRNPFPKKSYQEFCNMPYVTWMDFYDYVGCVLGNIQSIQDSNFLHESSYNANYLSVEDLNLKNKSVWKDPDKNEYWVIENIKDSYIYTRYNLNKMHFARFEGVIFKDKKRTQIIMRSPECLKSYLNNIPEPPGLFRIAPIHFEREHKEHDNEGLPPVTAIHIDVAPSNCGILEALPSTLVRTSLTAEYDRFKECTNEFKEYDYEIRYIERMRTPFFIFIARNMHDQGNGIHRVTSWYRIPIFSPEHYNTFLEFPTDETIVNLNFESERYLFFPHYRKAFKVTTAKDCEAQNIAVVKSPVVPTISTEINDFNINATEICEEDEQLIVRTHIDILYHLRPGQKEMEERSFIYEECFGGMNFQEDEMPGSDSSYTARLLTDTDSE